MFSRLRKQNSSFCGLSVVADPAMDMAEPFLPPIVAIDVYLTQVMVVVVVVVGSGEGSGGSGVGWRNFGRSVLGSTKPEFWK